MSDIGIFTPGDTILLLVLAGAAVIWPLATSVWAWYRGGFGFGALSLALSVVLLWLAMDPLGLADAADAWPIMIVWAVIPLLSAFIALRIAAWRKRAPNRD
jgi:hypothetical protein